MNCVSSQSVRLDLPTALPGAKQMMTRTLNQENTMLFFGLYVATALLGLAGNLLVLRTFWYRRRGSYFHMQLAAANILNLSAIVMAAPSALAGRWLFGDVLCSWFGVQAFTAGFAVMTFICIICIECYLATQQKHLYKKLSPLVFKLIATGVWLYALGFSVAPLLGWNRIGREGHSSSCGLDLDHHTASGHSYFMTTQTVFLAFAVAAIGCFVLTLVRRGVETNVFGPVLSDTDLIKVSGSLLVGLTISCIPYYIRVIWYLLGYQPFFCDFLGVEFSHLSMKFGSAAHSVAYFALSGSFRSNCLAVMTCAGVTNKQK